MSGTPFSIGQDGSVAIEQTVWGLQDEAAHTEANAGPAVRARTTTATMAMYPKRFKCPPALPFWA